MTDKFPNLQFHSTDHIRFQNGLDVSGHNKGCNRGIEIINHPDVEDAFLVTIYNLDGNHPVWGDNVQMAPKRMRIVYNSNNVIKLQGFGYDRMGTPFSDYGLSIYSENNLITKIVLHMIDRSIDIEYYP